MPKDDAINFYDDKSHNYEDFWVGRDYEHSSEIVAINKLVGNDHFSLTMDYGGGYGRLAPVLLKYSDHLLLVDPSKQQLDIGRSKLGKNKNVEFVLLKRANHIPSDDSSLDLLVMVRVSHHIPDLKPTFSEIHRVLKPGGKAIIEIANYNHIKNRLKSYTRFKRLPRQPVQIGHVANGINDKTPFVNHNPKTVEAILKQHDLRVVKKLSASNFRSTTLKKRIGIKSLVSADKLLQPSLASIYFGPSIIYLVEKDK